MKSAIVLLVAVMVLHPALSVAGDDPPSGAVDAASTVRSGKSNSDNRVGAGVDAATSVKSGKSNSDNRAGGSAGNAGNGAGSERGTTVKSSKSNTND
jgi:hypothetical protein